MARKPYILTDFDTNNPMGEYFRFRGIEYDFLPDEPTSPLVDQIAHRIDGKDNVYLVFGALDTLRRLYDERSKINDFATIGEKHNLVIFGSNKMTSESLNPLSEFSKDDPDYADWLNSMEPVILVEGIAGEFFKKSYPDCEFIQVFTAMLVPRFNNPQLAILKDHRPDKDYFCLMNERGARPYRKILHQRLSTEGLTDNAIYKFARRNDNTYDDLIPQYPEGIAKSLGFGGGQIFPPIHYYNRTNFELVAETFTQTNHDETFFLSEKTLKPISMKHPFMILSNYNHLKNLHDMGFKTFHEHVDESYDNKTDFNERIDIIIKNLKTLIGNSQGFYTNTKEIREHNHRHLQYMIGGWKTALWKGLDKFWRNI